MDTLSKPVPSSKSWTRAHCRWTRPTEATYYLTPCGRGDGRRRWEGILRPELWALWAGGLFVGCGLAVLAGRIARKRQAHRAPPPNEFDDIIQAIRSEIERIVQFGKLTNKKVTIMGDAVIALIKENRSRFEHLQKHTEELDGRTNEQGHHVRSIGGAIAENSEKIRQIDDVVTELGSQLSEAIDGFSQFQKNIDQQSSEENEVKRVSLESLAGHIATLSQQVDAVVTNYADPGGSLKSLAQSVAALAADVAHIRDSTHELEKHVISIQSNLADLTARLESAENSINELGRVSNGQFQPGQSIFRVVRPS
jgi:DNA repair exonuclease SbcCD ATPase subunit